MSFTEYRDHHMQVCPHCGLRLETTEDWFGGGSHYWNLKCTHCGLDFMYDTYRFRLDAKEQEDWKTVARWNERG